MKATELRIVEDSELTTVLFQWEASVDALSYELVLSNISNLNQIRVETDLKELSVSIERGATYTWFVISKYGAIEEDASENLKETPRIEMSDIWCFYSAGNAEQTYTPITKLILDKQDNN